MQDFYGSLEIEQRRIGSYGSVEYILLMDLKEERKDMLEILGLQDDRGASAPSVFWDGLSQPVFHCWNNALLWDLAAARSGHLGWRTPSTMN